MYWLFWVKRINAWLNNYLINANCANCHSCQNMAFFPRTYIVWRSICPCSLSSNVPSYIVTYVVSGIDVPARPLWRRFCHKEDNFGYRQKIKLWKLNANLLRKQTLWISCDFFNHMICFFNIWFFTCICSLWGLWFGLANSYICFFFSFYI